MHRFMIVLAMMVSIIYQGWLMYHLVIQINKLRMLCTFMTLHKYYIKLIKQKE